MSEQNVNPSVEDSAEGDRVDAQEQPTLTHEEALTELAKLKEVNAELVSTRNAAAAKLRKIEEDKSKAEQQQLEEQGQFKELMEQQKSRADALQQRLREQSANTELKNILKAEQAKSLDTALKLIDRSEIKYGDDDIVDVESIKAAVMKLKETDGILFGAVEQERDLVKTPDVRRPSDNAVKTFEQEMAEFNKKPIKSQAEFDAILKRHNRF